MSSYQASMVIENMTGSAMTNVFLLHTWPQGGIAEVVLSLPSLASGATSSAGTVNSGTGGSDYFTLLFNLSSGSASIMIPYDVQILQADSTITVNVEQDNQVAFNKPNSTDPAPGTWGQYTSSSSGAAQPLADSASAHLPA
jgi:hypothetical protein